MKNAIIFSLLALLLLGGGIALWQSKTLPASTPATPVENAPLGITDILVEESTATPAAGGATVEVAKIDGELRRKAAEILARPIRGGDGLPPAVREDLVRQIREATAVLTNDYNTMQPWISLGLARKAFDDYEGAAEAWEFAGTIRPKNSLSFANLGFLYGSYMKEYARAEKNYLQAIANDPREVSAYNNLSDIYWYSIPEKREIIPELLMAGLKVNTDRDHRVPLMARLAIYYKDSGAFGKAADVMKELITLLPEEEGLVAELEYLRAKAAGE